MIQVHDDVLPDPRTYRAAVLRQHFDSVTVGPVTFHGIAPVPDDRFVRWFAQTFPQYEPTLTFARKSPAGQAEPNFIHTDDDMGDVTALLYLNPDPPADDGTTFWRHSASGALDGAAWLADGQDLAAWEPTQHVPARFNRCVVFAAPLFHSRALEGNFGQGDEARLVQVLFARVRE